MSTYAGDDGISTVSTESGFLRPSASIHHPPIHSIHHPPIHFRNIKSLPNLAVEQGLNGGWEFATLSFPCWHLAPRKAGLPASRRYSPRQAESSAS